MLSPCSAKPPVPAVENAVVIASKNGILAINKHITSIVVNTKYIEHIISAVFLTLGTNFPTFGPVLSAFIIFIFPAPDKGRTAIINTKTPIPPIQCVMLRQKSIHFGKASKLSIMVAPVVVNPETDSNKAFINDMFGISVGATRIRNGNAPNIDNASHPNETITNPSRANNF